MRTIVYDLTALDTRSRYRGTGRYLRDLALGLSRLLPHETRGLRLLGLTHLHWDGSYEVTEDLASFTGSPQKPTDADHFRFSYKRRLVLWKALRSIGADVVHLGDATGVPLLMDLTTHGRASASTLGPTRRVVTCHDFTAALWPDRYFSWKDGGQTVGRWIENRRYQSADLVVAISDATRGDVTRFSRVDPEKVVRVYNGIDVARWAAVPPGGDAQVVERHGLSGTNYVIYVGDLAWHKNLEGMLGGLAAARQKGVPVFLAIAGLLSQERAANVQILAQKHGVTDLVKLLGYVPDDDLPSLFRHARAHLFVSRAEGFGMTVAEAMAAGTPVITSTARALVEVGGDAVLACDPENHANIGNAIVRVVTEASLREQLIQRGFARAPLFCNEQQARGYVDVYRRAAELRSSPPGEL